MKDNQPPAEPAGEGDPRAAELLLPLLYNELRNLAAARLAREDPGQTLQPTALVHEAYLRLAAGREGGQLAQWNSRGHFFAAAAQAMRRILVENARRRKRLKRGGGAWQRVQLGSVPNVEVDDQFLALDEALTRLATEDPLAAKVVELRRYGGVEGHTQVAEALGVTTYQARQKWEYAKARLTLLMRGP